MSLVSHTLANTTGSLSLGSKTTEFSVLLDTSGNPLVFWVVSDGIVLWVHKDDLKKFVKSISNIIFRVTYFEVLVGRIFTNPVGVENTEGTAVATDTLFGNRLKSASELHEDTLVNWFTHGGTLWYWLLASTTSDTDSFYQLATNSLICISKLLEMLHLWLVI